MAKPILRKIIQIFPRLGDGQVHACFYGLADDGSIWLLVRKSADSDALEWRELLSGELSPAAP